MLQGVVEAGGEGLVVERWELDGVGQGVQSGQG